MRRLGLETNLRENLTDEDAEGAAEDVTAYMNQAIEGQEQILPADVCNKWTLSFLQKADEAKYSAIMVKNTHGKQIKILIEKTSPIFKQHFDF